VKIATFNVNGITARLPTLLRWLEESRPDIACLQELKAPQERFPEAAIREAGYGFAWHGQKSWNGVAILARGADPVERRRVLPGDPEDLHSRYIEATVGDIVVGCLYLPNGNPAPGPKFDYKLRWFDRLSARAAELVAREEPVVLAGDYNVIPEARDAEFPAAWEGDALFRPQTREAFRALKWLGFSDAYLEADGAPGAYTFWDYQAGAFQRDDGIRIDHLALSPEAADRLRGAAVLRYTRSWEKPSDHVPVAVDLDLG